MAFNTFRYIFNCAQDNYPVEKKRSQMNASVKKAATYLE